MGYAWRKSRIFPFLGYAMKIIKRLTDKEVLGTDGLSNAKPRYTARAIVKNDAGLYAVMYAEKFNLYSLPGGGVEGDETPRQALEREIREETGYACKSVQELGIVEENRFHANYTQVSYYYIVTVSGEPADLTLTDGERASSTEVQWHPLEQVKALISNPTHDTAQRNFLQARDVAALNAYFGR